MARVRHHPEPEPDMRELGAHRQHSGGRGDGTANGGQHRARRRDHHHHEDEQRLGVLDPVRRSRYRRRDVRVVERAGDRLWDRRHGHMVLTTLMTFIVVRFGWRYPLVLAATGFFLVIELVFFASTAVKILSGGWFTLLVAGLVFTLMLTWKQGRTLLSEQLRKDSIDLRSFLDAVFTSAPTRVEGTAVFMTAEPDVTPSALMHNLKHNRVLHDQNIFVTVQHHEVPWIPLDKRVEMEPLGRHCWKVTLNFGFKNDPNVSEALQRLKGRGLDLEDSRTSYFLSRDIVIPTVGAGMAAWREKLFANLHRNSSRGIAAARTTAATATARQHWEQARRRCPDAR